MNGSSGFIYYVAITGITGTRSATSEHLSQAIPRVRKATTLPIAIGFGVRTPAQAAEASQIADAAVVASALIETLSHHLDPDWQRDAGHRVDRAGPGAGTGEGRARDAGLTSRRLTTAPIRAG